MNHKLRMSCLLSTIMLKIKGRMVTFEIFYHDDTRLTARWNSLSLVITCNTFFSFCLFVCWTEKLVFCFTRIFPYQCDIVNANSRLAGL